MITKNTSIIYKIPYMRNLNSSPDDIMHSIHPLPLVSIIIPTFNRAELLMMALKSLQNQRLTNWEVLVVNDGGENIDEVIANMNDYRIILLNHTTNKGVSAARIQDLNKKHPMYVTIHPITHN